MKLQEAIANRLLKLRTTNKYSQAFVAQKLNITQAAYSLIEASKNRLGTEHILALSELYRVPTDYLLKGERNFVSVSEKSGFITRNMKKAHAGFIKNNTENLIEDESEYFRIPGYDAGISLKLFEIEGTSMVPSMFHGDIVICQAVEPNKLEDHDAVIVITQDAALAKRVLNKMDSGKIAFFNDNKEEDNTVLEMSLEEIKDIYMIRGKITNTLVPYHQMVSKGKIKELNDYLEYLKKEIYQINKKIDNEL